MHQNIKIQTLITYFNQLKMPSSLSSIHIFSEYQKQFLPPLEMGDDEKYYYEMEDDNGRTLGTYETFVKARTDWVETIQGLYDDPKIGSYWFHVIDRKNKGGFQTEWSKEWSLKIDRDALLEYTLELMKENERLKEEVKGRQWAVDMLDDYPLSIQRVMKCYRKRRYPDSK